MNYKVCLFKKKLKSMGRIPYWEWDIVYPVGYDYFYPKTLIFTSINFWGYSFRIYRAQKRNGG
jgi:hypothetical protein